MRTTTEPKKSWDRLTLDKEKTYVVTHEDGDSVVLPYEDLAKACLYAEDRGILRTQIGQMFAELNAMLTRHASQIDRAYLSLRPTGITCVVVQKSKEVDAELDEALIDFDISVAQNSDYGLIRFEILALPFVAEDAVQSFVPTDKSTLKRIF